MALINKLNAIGDAIREKTGKSDLLTLEQMPVEIAAIETGGGGDLPEEAFIITGKCSYMFSENKWKWFIDMYGNKITTKDISDMSQMFIRSNVEAIPFDFNITKDCKAMNYAFGNCGYLKEIPLIKGDISAPTSNYSGLSIGEIFLGCYRVRTIPHDYFYNLGGDAFWEASKKYSSSRNGVFASCCSLRKLPDISMLKTTSTSTWDTIYYEGFRSCSTLDEIIDLITLDSCNFTSNAFRNTFDGCHRLKELTFETNEDGTPKIANWKNQIIDLYANGSTIGFGGVTYSSGVPYVNGSTTLQYNSGITVDKIVDSDEKYQALKNDPDWTAANAKYSRYNHDSAVNTINSLPDTSAYLATAGGTNTIKFVSFSGSLTDGGSIDKLTEEEIAVAAAKGWTVTFAI